MHLTFRRNPHQSTQMSGFNRVSERHRMARNQVQAWTQKGSSQKMQSRWMSQLRSERVQHVSEPRKETILLEKTDTEMRELLIRLIAQNQEHARPDEGNELDDEVGSSAADIKCQQVT